MTDTINEARALLANTECNDMIGAVTVRVVVRALVADLDRTRAELARVTEERNEYEAEYHTYLEICRQREHQISHFHKQNADLRAALAKTPNVNREIVERQIGLLGEIVGGFDPSSWQRQLIRDITQEKYAMLSLLVDIPPGFSSIESFHAHAAMLRDADPAYRLAVRLGTGPYDRSDECEPCGGTGDTDDGSACPDCESTGKRKAGK